jgi:hypothetical protein
MDEPPYLKLFLLPFSKKGVFTVTNSSCSLTLSYKKPYLKENALPKSGAETILDVCSILEAAA